MCGAVSKSGRAKPLVGDAGMLHDLLGEVLTLDQATRLIQDHPDALRREARAIEEAMRERLTQASERFARYQAPSLGDLSLALRFAGCAAEGATATLTRLRAAGGGGEGGAATALGVFVVETIAAMHPRVAACWSVPSAGVREAIAEAVRFERSGRMCTVQAQLCADALPLGGRKRRRRGPAA